MSIKEKLHREAEVFRLVQSGEWTKIQFTTWVIHTGYVEFNRGVTDGFLRLQNEMQKIEKSMEDE